MLLKTQNFFLGPYNDNSLKTVQCTTPIRTWPVCVTYIFGFFFYSWRLRAEYIKKSVAQDCEINHNVDKQQRLSFIVYLITRT